MKRIVQKRFLKKKKNFNTMMFNVVDVKNSNAKIFRKYHIDDTTTISNNFTKFSFEVESFLKKKNAAQTYEKKQKKIRKRTKTKVSKRRKRKRQINEFLFFV